MRKRRYKIATLGCRTNQYESEAFATQLRSLGAVEAGPGEEADLCIVNTCTVTQSADRHSRHQIRKLARLYPQAQLFVTGCLAERVPEEIQALKGVSRVVPNLEKETLLTYAFPDEPLPEFSIENFSAHTRAFVKVQDGCNSFCTYCIIPYVRGRSRSRPVDEIIQEINTLVSHGYKEVVLTGINIGDFSGDKGESLADLVKAVDEIEGLKRIRVSSIDPDEVDDELMSAILEGKHTSHSMHIVLQSGSNGILKRMNRKYTRQIFLETVHKLRQRAPDFTVTTDIIVGFPGESEGDFQETLEVMREVQFAKIHMFPYSERKKTRAALYSSKIPLETIQRRKQELLHEGEKIAFALRNSYVGKTVEILVEGGDPSSGHTDNFIPVILSEKRAPHETLLVRCVENSPLGLRGVIE